MRDFVYKVYRKSALALIVFVSCRRFPVSLLNLFIAVPLFWIRCYWRHAVWHIRAFAIRHICSTSTLSTVSNLPNHAVNLQLRISSLYLHSTNSISHRSSTPSPNHWELQWLWQPHNMLDAIVSEIL